jgi:hypothetical protein
MVLKPSAAVAFRDEIPHNVPKPQLWVVVVYRLGARVFSIRDFMLMFG